MAWNDKYWDIIDRYYWTPKYLGLSSINRKHWIRKDGLICIPNEFVGPTSSIFTRSRKASENKGALLRSEEPLNDIFNLTFAIAPDAIISEFFLGRLNIFDNGPFTSIGRELVSRLGLDGENVTQHDGFFVSDNSIVGIEIKLNTKSSAVQIIKYMTLMVLMERQAVLQKNLGLIFIAPAQDESRFWLECDLEGPNIDDGFLDRAVDLKINSRIQVLLKERLEHFQSAAKRLQLKFMSWTDLRADIDRTMEGLTQTEMGQQTLYRLLAGFRDQLNIHGDTSIDVRRMD